MNSSVSEIDWAIDLNRADKLLIVRSFHHRHSNHNLAVPHGGDVFPGAWERFTHGYVEVTFAPTPRADS